MQHLIGKVVQFKKSIEDMEAYPENQMCARIVSIRGMYTDSPNPREHVYDIKFDYSEFDEYNARLETANYYGMDQIPNKTAREAGHYDVEESIYFGNPDIWPFENYFAVVDQNKNKLLERFKESGEENYVEWLENRVLKSFEND